jgi:hypothetical protein
VLPADRNPLQVRAEQASGRLRHDNTAVLGQLHAQRPLSTCATAEVDLADRPGNR